MLELSRLRVRSEKNEVQNMCEMRGLIITGLGSCVTINKTCLIDSNTNMV